MSAALWWVWTGAKYSRVIHISALRKFKCGVYVQFSLKKKSDGANPGPHLFVPEPEKLVFVFFFNLHETKTLAPEPKTEDPGKKIFEWKLWLPYAQFWMEILPNFENKICSIL